MTEKIVTNYVEKLARGKESVTALTRGAFRFEPLLDSVKSCRIMTLTAGNGDKGYGKEDCQVLQ
ncbi:hypothetical protein [Paenibacillus chibensis]|nr:hypothetical protein [Paenibacillus chibensis]MEC0373677.1 hypothetical protein [Paenibacillus chibensis]